MKTLTLFSVFFFLQLNFVKAQENTPNYTFKNPSAGCTGKVYMGREIAQVMSFDGLAWLERSNREMEENASKAIAKLPITKESIVADLGAGSGYYTFRIAKKVPAGKVYAVEIQDDAITYLKKKIVDGKFNNITTVKGNERSPNLPNETIDLAIMVDVYHELLYPAAFLQAIKKSLKPTGKLLLLEYKAEDEQVAIKPEHKMSVAQVKKELLANGFKLVQNGQFLPIQHFLVFEKN